MQVLLCSSLRSGAQLKSVITLIGMLMLFEIKLSLLQVIANVKCTSPSILIRNHNVFGFFLMILLITFPFKMPWEHAFFLRRDQAKVTSPHSMTSRKGYWHCFCHSHAWALCLYVSIGKEGSVPELKYKCHTVKKLMMQRVFLSEKKENESDAGKS